MHKEKCKNIIKNGWGDYVICGMDLEEVILFVSVEKICPFCNPDKIQSKTKKDDNIKLQHSDPIKDDQDYIDFGDYK